jgi:hypothetical protein
VVSKNGGIQNPEDLDVSDDSFDCFLHDVNKPHDLATSQYDMISMYLNFVKGGSLGSFCWRAESGCNHNKETDSCKDLTAQLVTG